MPSQPYIQEWPFGAQEAVLLTWVRSPRQRTDEKQWCVSVCFETEDENWHRFEMPWGMLPLLRLGQRYANGFMLPREFMGEETSLTLRGEPTLVPAREVLGAGFFPENCRDAGHDLCLLFEGRRPVALPVTEAIRVLFARNRALALGLFEPQYLDKIVAAARIEEDCLHLEFNKEVALKSLSKPIVGHLARLLYDPSFREAWDSVARERFSAVGPHGNNHPWPLTCRLPALKPTWNVRLRTLGDVSLILEILDAEPMADLPFSHSGYTHPDMVATRKGKSKPRSNATRGKAGAAKVDVANAAVAISTKSRGPRAPSEPRELLGPSFPILGLKAIFVTRDPKVQGTRTAAPVIVDESGPDTVEKKATEPATAVSVADAAPPGPGRLPAGEFKPAEPSVEGLEMRPPPLTRLSVIGLNLFAEMLDYLAGHNPANLRLDWCTGLFPEAATGDSRKELRFARVGALRRSYALVRLRWQKVTAWALEFGQPDGRTPSTLVFQPATDAPQGGVKALVEKILWEALTSDGNWRESKLAQMREANEIRYELAKHLSKMPDTWGRRLYRKAAELAGATPAYIQRPH